MNGEDFKEGIIVRISDNFIWVSIEQNSACSGCHAKGYCTSTDCKTRIIKFNKRQNDSLSLGDRVRVNVSDRVGFLSVFVAFVIPLIVILVTVFLSSYYFDSKYVAVFTLFATVLYFCVIYLFRNVINRFVKIEYKSITNDLQ